jgi:hypothetical protein
MMRTSSPKLDETTACPTQPKSLDVSELSRLSQRLTLTPTCVVQSGATIISAQMFAIRQIKVSYFNKSGCGSIGQAPLKDQAISSRM